MHFGVFCKKGGESISFIQLIWGTVLLNYPFSTLMSHCFLTIFVSLPWAVHNHHSWVKSLTVPPNLTRCKGVCGMPSCYLVKPLFVVSVLRAVVKCCFLMLSSVPRCSSISKFTDFSIDFFYYTAVLRPIWDFAE